MPVHSTPRPLMVHIENLIASKQNWKEMPIKKCKTLFAPQDGTAHELQSHGFSWLATNPRYTHTGATIEFPTRGDPVYETYVFVSGMVSILIKDTTKLISVCRATIDHLFEKHEYKSKFLNSKKMQRLAQTNTQTATTLKCVLCVPNYRSPHMCTTSNDESASVSVLAYFCLLSLL